MKTFPALAMLIVLALVGQSLAGAPATQPAAHPVSFDTHGGYFVSNKFEPKQADSFVVLRDQAAFDEVFGAARVMGDKSHRLPADAFDSKIVVAAIKRGKAVWEFKVKEIVEVNGVLTVRYTTTQAKSDSAEFACPLIVSVPRAHYESVVFEADGKIVQTIEKTWIETKQEASEMAEKADAELNKVYASTGELNRL